MKRMTAYSMRLQAGVGFRKLILERKQGEIHLKSQKRYHFFYEQKEITMFYPMLAEGDSILWLGSREKRVNSI